MELELSARISNLYSLPPIVSTSSLNGGFLNENSVIETNNGNKYVLKRHRESNARKIEYIERAEQFFHDHGIPVILPIKTHDGSSHFIHQERLYSLHPFVSGIQPERGLLTQQQIIELATILAQTHLLSKDGVAEMFLIETQKSWDTKKSLETMNEIETIIRGKTNKKEEFDDLALKSLGLKQAFITSSKLLPERFQFNNDTLIHGDYHDQNVFFDSDGRIAHVFDFEKTKYSSRLYEFIRSMMLICFNHSFLEKNFEKAKLYLTTYRNFYPFNNTELSTNLRAYTMKEFHSTWIEGEHYQKQNTTPDVFLPGHFESLKYLKSNLGEFESKLLSWFDE